jgi:CAAX prenyl protease-like protein
VDVYHYNSPHPARLSTEKTERNETEPVAEARRGGYAEWMDEPTATPDQTPPLVERYRWLPLVLPFAVYMIVTALEPSGDRSYPAMYALKIVLTLVAAAMVWRGYRQFPLRITPLALVVGLVGGPLWIGLCSLHVEQSYLWPLLKNIGLGFLTGGERPGFNPFAEIDFPGGAWMFLAVRFLGLVAVVPLIEEFFLRGFLMRFVMDRDWWAIPFGKVDMAAIVVGTAFPVLSHPEWLAAAVWFSMITWLMVRTRNIWDCVAAHAITNLILGVYVVWHGGAAWRLL